VLQDGIDFWLEAGAQKDQEFIPEPQVLGLEKPEANDRNESLKPSIGTSHSEGADRCINVWYSLAGSMRPSAEDHA
jgi:hypothetical protein